jgi:hypothetical protein
MIETQPSPDENNIGSDERKTEENNKGQQIPDDNDDWFE